ncbi:MAG: hypothetical protein ACJKTH_01005 [Patescibacteria group bacterium UBA2163]
MKFNLNPFSRRGSGERSGKPANKDEAAEGKAAEKTVEEITEDKKVLGSADSEETPAGHGSEEDSSDEDGTPEQGVETSKEGETTEDQGTFAANAARENARIAHERRHLDWVLSRSKAGGIALGKGLGKVGVGTWEFSKNHPRIAGGTLALGVFGITLYFALTGEVDTDILTETDSLDTPPEGEEGGAAASTERTALENRVSSENDPILSERTPEGAVGYEGESDAQNENSSSLESPEPELEIPTEVNVVAQPGDGAITMLMRWAEAADGHTFPEGSPMEQLVSAHQEGNDTLYGTAQRIAIDSGLYQPNEVNESFNVHIGAQLGTVAGNDGTFSFTLSNPGENSGAHTLWSDTSPEVQRYEGDNMLDTTTPRESTGDDIEPEKTFEYQASALHLSERAWGILSSEPIPQVFADGATSTNERVQALIALAEERDVALTEEGASALTKLITLTGDPQMAERYGAVPLQQGGEMRTIQEFLLDGFRKRGTGA